MSKSKCFVPKCPNSKEKNPEKYFFCVNDRVKKSWCRQINVPYIPKRLYLCCEDHLNLEEDLENYHYWKLMKGRPILKSSARLKLNTSDQLCELTSKEQAAPVLSGSSSEETPLTDTNDLDSNTGVENPLATEQPHKTPQCRFCAEYTESCVDMTDEDRPYLTRNKTTITLNHLSVELDFSNGLPKTVCRVCDEKLLETFGFLKQVKEAQDSLNSVSDAKEEVYVLIVKTECESPTPDNADIYSNVDIVNSLSATKTVKPIIKCKRKGVECAPGMHKKPKVTEIKSKESELIVDIKEEPVDMVDAHEAENSKYNTDIDITPSKLESNGNPKIDPASLLQSYIRVDIMGYQIFDRRK